MGNINSRAHGGSDNGVLFLLCRTWAVVVPTSRRRRSKNLRRSSVEAATSECGSQYSFCSCSQCHRDDDLTDYTSDIFGPSTSMSPNSDESGRLAPFSKSTKSVWSDDTLSKEKQRPPIYNPEDYALSLKKWGRRPPAGSPGLYASPAEVECPLKTGASQSTLITNGNGTQRDYRNLKLTSGAAGEMTLRQFGTVSELLTKLRADLRLAFPSFVQEFIGDPLDGVTLLLELLRAIQLSQAGGCGTGQISGSGSGSSGSGVSAGGAMGRVSPAVQRRALLDELACLQCLLCCCQRYSEAVRRLTASSAGLFTLAVCIMSNVNKSRIIALQLLTKACEPIGNGHSSVSEALSTLRLRFGEPVRFRFLVGMLTSAGGHSELLAAGLRFLNMFLESAGNTQRRLYIQAELEQAGFDIAVVRKIVNINSPSYEHVFSEIERWDKGHIDIEAIIKRAKDMEKENISLKDKMTLFERRVKILQEEKGVLMSLEQCLKERCCELQDEVTSLKSGKPQKKVSRDSSLKIGEQSPAEDEGISSSERSLTPEQDMQREPLVYEMYNVKNETLLVKPKGITNSYKDDSKTLADDDEEETTIEEVIEELRNIINDAETEAYANEKKEEEERKRIEEAQIASKIQMRVDSNVIIDDEHLLETEAEIVPSLHPQPPRKTRSLVHLYIPTEEYEYHQKEMFFENETQFMSDESSDSLLSASKCQMPKVESPQNIPVPGNNNRELLNTIMDARDRAILQEKRRQKKVEMMKALKRSESFQHVIPSVQLVEVNDNLKTTIKQNSFDGLFFVTNFSNTPSSPTVVHQKLKSNKAKEDFAKQKLISKSLDRIDDGLDAMVDIIVTSDQNVNPDQRLHSKSDSGHITEATTGSRSTTNLYSQIKKDSSTTKFSGHSQQKLDDKHRIFLPVNKYDSRENENQFYFPRIQENNPNSFLIKRGHTNAGLYSGQHIIRDSPSSAKRTSVISSNSYRTTTTNKRVISLGKLTDLPSGLY